MSTSLALTDGVLLLTCFYIARGAAASVGVRLALSVIGLAAALGVLKFSGVAPMPGMHSFLSQISSVAALPLLALVLLDEQAAVSVSAKFAWIFLVVLSAVGLIITTGLGIKAYGPIMAAGSVMVLLIGLARRGRFRQGLGALVMLAGMALFVAKVSVGNFLTPGDFLHLGMALGLLGLRPPLQSASTA